MLPGSTTVPVDPTAAPASVSPDAARAELLDAVAYALDEIALLRGVIGRIPEALHGERPRPDRLSLRETYALLAERDRARAAAFADGPDGPFPPPANTPDADAATRPTAALLDEAEAARRAWLAALTALPGAVWADPDAPLGARVHAALLADAALLRDLAESLFDVRARAAG